MPRLIPTFSNQQHPKFFSSNGPYRGGYGGGYGRGDYPALPLAANVSPQIQEPTPAPVGPAGMPMVPATVYDSASTPGIATAGPLRGKRVGSSPNFQASLVAGRQAKASDRLKNADFVANRSRLIQEAGGSVGAPPPPSAPPVTPEPSTGTLSETLQRAKMPPVPGITTRTGTNYQSPDPTRAATLGGTPPTPAAPLTTEGMYDHFQSEMQRSRNVASQQSRGLGLQVRDGGAFQPMPYPGGTPATPGTEPQVKDFARPAGAHGLSQEQLAAIDLQARQGAHVANQRRMADVETGGMFANEARQDAMVGAQADMAQARVLDAQRPRQATPGTGPKGPTLGEMREELDAQVGLGDPNNPRPGQIEQQIDQRMGIAPPTTQPSAPLAPLQDNQALTTPPSQPVVPAAPGANTRTSSSPNFRESVARGQLDLPAQNREPGATKALTPEMAKQFLAKAGGDKNKARELARAAGHTF